VEHWLATRALYSVLAGLAVKQLLSASLAAQEAEKRGGGERWREQEREQERQQEREGWQ